MAGSAIPKSVTVSTAPSKWQSIRTYFLIYNIYIADWMLLARIPVCVMSGRKFAFILFIKKVLITYLRLQKIAVTPSSWGFGAFLEEPVRKEEFVCGTCVRMLIIYLFLHVTLRVYRRAHLRGYYGYTRVS